jgi:AcrR family transcriptional regulator
VTRQTAKSPRRSGTHKGVRRRLHPDTRRGELIDAAVRVLRSRGPEACRVEDITDAAGTAKGNFYRYFPTWDDLLVAVRDQLLESYRTEIVSRYADNSSLDWWSALDDEIQRFVDFQLDLGGLHDAMFHGPAAVLHPVEPHRSAQGTVGLFLQAGIKEGQFADVDVDVTAPLLFDLMHGAADNVAAGFDRERVLRAVLRIVHRALEPDRSNPSRPSKRRSGN